MQVVEYSIDQIRRLIPYPQVNDNKYSRGVVHIVGGDALYPGAAALAACAAQRAGAGYVTVWCSPSSVHDIRAGHASLVVRPWDCAQLEPKLRHGAKHRAVLAIGSGFGAEGETERALFEAAIACDVPMLIDGGGLGIAANYAYKWGNDVFTQRAEKGLPLILTPHMGEALSMCAGIGCSAVTQEEIALQLAQYYCAVVVVKGPNTVIANERGVLHTMTEGTAALAKAGTGDVLAGMIAAALSQGLSAFDAAVFGAYVHARAGLCAAEELTSVCVIPEDVIEHIPDALRAIKKLPAE